MGWLKRFDEDYIEPVIENYPHPSRWPLWLRYLWIWTLPVAALVWLVGFLTFWALVILLVPIYAWAQAADAVLDKPTIPASPPARPAEPQ